MSRLDDTTLTRLELWDARIGGWVVAHKGVPLLHPEAYSKRLAGNGKVARAIVIETGQVFQDVPTPTVLPACDFCGERHAAPNDGTCLL